MALKRNERYPGRFSNPTTAHPQGAFKNRTAPSSQDGSYLEQDWANDWDAFFSSLLDAAGVTANGNVDAVGASQYFDALKASMTGRKIAEQWITASRTLVLNPLTKRIRVTITGGGGGGAGAFNGGAADNTISGGGGAAGATCIKWLNVSDITNYMVTIGVGGTEATKGGNSTFNGITAVGGNPAVTSTVYSSGGIGAAGTGGDINIAGGDGNDGQNGTRFFTGFGGSSFWGGCRRAGQGSAGVPTVVKASVPGGGGGGAFDAQTLSIRFYGAQGADGICLIEEFI